MSWFAELAGKAENLLNNFDEQTGVALRNHNVIKQTKIDRNDSYPEPWTTTTQMKRPIPRNWRKISGEPKSRNGYNSPSKKCSPTELYHSPTREPKAFPKQSPKPKKKRYGPNYEPTTLVSDIKDSHINVDHQSRLKERRYSMPSKLDMEEDRNVEIENLEIENTMLKNELNVANRDVSEMLMKLRQTEKGEDVVVVIEEELMEAKQNSEYQKTEFNNEKMSLTQKIDELKKELHDLRHAEQKKYNDKISQLQIDISNLKEENRELENLINEKEAKTNDKEAACMKLENELRHAQSNIFELQSNLEKSNEECKRLEKDWDTYKHRVKSMLQAKDKEIKSLQEGMCFNDDSKLLLEKIENLKEERNALNEMMVNVRGECEEMRQYIDSMETRNKAAERVVGALRDALKDERFARTRAESQYGVVTKELKSIQMETGQTIANLRAALREKEFEINRLRESASSPPASDGSALNVADYDSNKDSDRITVQCLSQKMVQRQSKIDSLLADNNTLKIQLAKAQSKCKSLISKQQIEKSDSVVDFNEDRHRTRHNDSNSSLKKLSVRMGLLIRRNPIFRIIIIIYMMGLHLWVMTVLFTSTPENNTLKPNRK